MIPNPFDFKIENPNDRIVFNLSRYDCEIIKRSLEESYREELYHTPWGPENPGEYPLRYLYKGNKRTKRIRSVINFIEKQMKQADEKENKEGGEE